MKKKLKQFHQVKNILKQSKNRKYTRCLNVNKSFVFYRITLEIR